MHTSRTTQNGVMLLEALVAILLISFGILGLIALWAASLKGASAAQYRTDASYLANEVIGEMWLAKANLAGFNTDDWEKRVAATLPAGLGTVAVANDQVTVTITWVQPGTPPAMKPHQFISIAHINGAGPT